MKEIKLLESEIALLQDTIQRLKEFQKDPQNRSWKQYKSHIVGELRHRCVALKQRLTLVQKITTEDLWKQ
jgi:hypothetical protein